MEIKDLKKEIENIKQRNKRVELDKKWEISLARVIRIKRTPRNAFTHF